MSVFFALIVFCLISGVIKYCATIFLPEASLVARERELEEELAEELVAELLVAELLVAELLVAELLVAELLVAVLETFRFLGFFMVSVILSSNSPDTNLLCKLPREIFFFETLRFFGFLGELVKSITTDFFLFGLDETLSGEPVRSIMFSIVLNFVIYKKRK
jgi:hypothetical protein